MKLFNQFGSRLTRALSVPNRTRPVFAAVICGVIAATSSLPAASLPAVEIAPSPLFLGSEIPGNLVLTPSVEWPTIDSLANLGPYDVTRAYMGYFDANKCYGYQYDSTETKRHFYPVSVVGVGHTCPASSLWSGNFMNWTATQTIDPFRLALTGGNRVVDTPTDTWLEKARSDSHASASIYPNHVLNVGLQTATPVGAGWGEMSLRIHNLGNKMYFTRTDFSGKSNLESPGTPVAYNPGAHTLSGKIMVSGVSVDDPTMYEVSVRVEVCNSTFPEPDCKKYSSGWKPEGLIQEYSQSIRYSIFGYLNDHNALRDGAGLRANQKFVGPYSYNPGQGAVSNTAAEWDPTTGVLNKNPDAASATQTNTDMGLSGSDAIVDSGVINYLNKFGQMTSTTHKEYDPVSELYYAAIRYIKNQGNVPAYSSVSGTSAEKYSLADGFPVITNWQDPVALRCQANVVLGIGDVNSWNDKNLPGTTSGATEPTKPAEVVADTTVDVVAAINKVMELEGLPAPALNSFSGRNNSAYIAGLAYDSHTRDIRPDLLGSQTVSTHWVDVREAQVLQPKAKNQYWLAAKYGGFRVPADYGDPYARTAPLQNSWWHDTADVLSTGDDRPDNFYVASEADKMVESLTRAFARIVAETSGTGASFGANSGKLQTGSTIYQSRYYSGSWRGELTAYSLDVDTGDILLPPKWVAGDQVPQWDTRKIYSNSGGTFGLFNWTNLSATDKSTLGSQAVVDYLRGDRTNETPAGGLRVRQGMLGDFVDSPPFFVGVPDAATYGPTGFTGASTFDAFAAAQATAAQTSGVAGVVYLGGNDGMLHGFNSETGVETFAYVPKAAFNANLKAYTVPKYVHQYTVDGEVTSASVYIGGAWKQVLVGTMGRGGRGIFALDVTDPSNVTLLWDKTGVDIPALGNNLGQPIIAQVADGDWRVILGNGPNSTLGAAQLLTVKLSDGSATSVNLASSAAADNGLAAPLVWNPTPKTSPFFTTAYAGDLKGNFWKVTGLGGASPTSLNLFTATDGVKAQPITAAPLGAIRPQTSETWLFFGTGRYLGNGDLGNTDVQTWYGIKDTNALIPNRGSLVQRNILAETVGDPTAIPPTFGGRATSLGTTAELASKSGWYLDLVSPGVGGKKGERMVVPNVFQGLALRGNTIIPNAGDPCNTAGEGFDMAIDPFTGGRLSAGFFDLTGDGKVSSADMITLPDGTRVHASGIRVASGANRATVIGNNSYLTLLNGGQKKNPVPQVTKFKRVSWREVIGD